MKWPVRSFGPKLAVILILGGLILGLAWPVMSQSPAEPQTLPKILEFDRKFCPVCKQSEEIIRAVQAMFPGQFVVERLYIDEAEHLFRRYRVAIVPTQIFVDAGGQEVFRHEGVFPKEKLIQKLRELKFIRE
jgi:thioredoxin 1